MNVFQNFLENCSVLFRWMLASFFIEKPRRYDKLFVCFTEIVNCVFYKFSKLSCSPQKFCFDSVDFKLEIWGNLFSSMELSSNSILFITNWHFIAESVLRIYINKELKLLCKQSIIKKLLIKVTKESVFTVNNRLMKQIYDCRMGGLISAVFSGMYMCKMKKNVAKTLKPTFYKQYVDDAYAKCEQDETDMLLI